MEMAPEDIIRLEQEAQSPDSEHEPGPADENLEHHYCRLCQQLWPCMSAQVASLEAKNEAMAAALRSLLEDGRLSATTHDGIRAALSPDAGKGWLEVREQAQKALKLYQVLQVLEDPGKTSWEKTQAMEGMGDYDGGWLEQDALLEGYRQKVDVAVRAALDALGGT